jgi:hypothetical protein
MLPKKKSKIYPTLYFRDSLIIRGQERLKDLSKTLFLKNPAMRKIISLAVALAWFLVSCQKETSTDTPNQNQRTDSSGTRLVRVVTFSGSSGQDSTVVEYTYDATGKLAEEHSILVINDNGNLVKREFLTRYLRDVTGRIVQFTNKGPVSDLGNAPDSVTETVTYKGAGLMQIAYLNDSSRVYEYDAQGRVSRTSDHQHFPLPSDPRKLVVYHVYTYDGAGNIAVRNEFTDADGEGNFELNISYKFEYDNQVNPLYFRDDAMIEFKWYLFASPNNLTKFSYDISDPRGLDDEASATYQYRMDGKPASSTYVGNGQTNFSVYYYQ